MVPIVSRTSRISCLFLTVSGISLPPKALLYLVMAAISVNIGKNILLPLFLVVSILLGVCPSSISGNLIMRLSCICGSINESAMSDIIRHLGSKMGNAIQLRQADKFNVSKNPKYSQLITKAESVPALLFDNTSNEAVKWWLDMFKLFGITDGQQRKELFTSLFNEVYQYVAHYHIDAAKQQALANRRAGKGSGAGGTTGSTTGATGGTKIESLDHNIKTILEGWKDMWNKGKNMTMSGIANLFQDPRQKQMIMAKAKLAMINREVAIRSINYMEAVMRSKGGESKNKDSEDWWNKMTQASQAEQQASQANQQPQSNPDQYMTSTEIRRPV